MSETFYSELGVGSDAEPEDIRRAYREHVKDTHPDVSDRPDARRSFKRLTTARDVLTDERERTRYDRLGHDSYVSEHVQESVWNGSTPDDTDTADGSGAETAGPDVTEQRKKYSTTATTGSASGRSSSAGSSSRTRVGNRGGTRSRTDGGYASESWQQASSVYQQSSVPVDDDAEPTLTATIRVLRDLGGWFVVHVVLILSALATTWFILTATPGGAVPPAALVGTVLLVPLVFGLSIMHIVLTVHT